MRIIFQGIMSFKSLPEAQRAGFSLYDQHEMLAGKDFRVIRKGPHGLEFAYVVVQC